jgi:hypothetical protein
MLRVNDQKRDAEEKGREEGSPTMLRKRLRRNNRPSSMKSGMRGILLMSKIYVKRSF